MNVRPYVKVLVASAREDSINTKRIAIALGISVFRVFLLLSIYAVAYKLNKAALSYENAVWSLGIYFAFIINLGIRNLFKIVEADVQSGEVELQLVKPLDWRLVKVCQLIGKNSVEFLLQLIVLPCFLWLMIGWPDISFWSPLFLLGFVALTIFAVISASYLFMSIGLAAFWLNDATSVFRLFDKTILIFGGGFVPIALLPIAVQNVVRFSPFGVYAAPTQLFNPGMASFLPSYIFSAVFWTICLILLSNFIWKRAQVKIEVNGG